MFLPNVELPSDNNRMLYVTKGEAWFGSRYIMKGVLRVCSALIIATLFNIDGKIFSVE